MSVVHERLDRWLLRFSDFGNCLLLEPTSWSWVYSTENPIPEGCIFGFPGFRQITDSDGKPEANPKSFDVTTWHLNPAAEPAHETE